MYRYDPVGVCIYCGSDGASERLTDEHIVPYALGGIAVLPKSSCNRCCDITSAFEMVCARELYGSFRAREGLPTRRPLERRSEVSVQDSAGHYTTVPEKGAVALFPIVRLAPPGALRIPPVEPDGWEGVELGVKSDSPREIGHWAKLQSSSLTFPLTIKLSAFARLCAKIGHGFAVAQFSLTGFEHWLPPYILGENSQLGYVVGSSDAPQQSDSVAASLNWSIHEAALHNLLVINVHLFPGMGQPPVSVVAGAISSSQYADIRARSTG
jgi:hypothetical protein